MDFTSSLDLGSSVLANIDNAGKNSISKSFRKVKTKGNAGEIVDDSPTNKTNNSKKSNKENAKDLLTQSRYRRRAFRKNKSNSILSKDGQSIAGNASSSKQQDNISDYFKSPMELEIITAAKNDNDLIRTNEGEGIQDKRQRLSENHEAVVSNNIDDMFAESMGFESEIRFSLKDQPKGDASIVNIDDSSIEIRDANISEEMPLEKAICTEDLKELELSFTSQFGFPENQHIILNTSEAKEEPYQEKEIENFAFDMSSEINFQTEPINLPAIPTISENKTTNDIPPTSSEHEENYVNIEETSFIGCASLLHSSKTKQLHENSILPSKKELLSIIKADELNFQETEVSTSQPLNKSTIKSDELVELNISKCSGRILNWSASSDSESQLRHAPASKPDVGVQTPQNQNELKNISNWGLPSSITKEYYSKGIREMFDWQVECLSNTKVLFEHANLVYSAPTSAGKTLVSEILTIKTVIERKKKVLIILPFISVVREKMAYLQDLLTSSGYRVDGFFGGYTPPGGFDNINIAICTIEKANSIVNKLLEHNKLDDIGMIVVDEIHLISDPGRGYILELLLAKVAYMCRMYSIKIQIVAMSATLSNIILLQKWLQAEFYVTNFRPVELQEMIKVGRKIYNNQMNFIRELNYEEIYATIKDQDHISQLCMETILIDCSVVVFCPSKDWCETLSLHLAQSIFNIITSKGPMHETLSSLIKKSDIDEVKMQLKNCPAGLDSVLAKTVTFGCAFHHAGLTSEERDIIESNFKAGILKILVATSTLSSGVNLPARRVIIRSPLFAGKKMNPLTYKQMIGRAGRTGKDTLGESILICNETNFKAGKELVCAELLPIRSCLNLESSMPLKRALLEVISSGVSTTKNDVQTFLECTLLHVQRNFESDQQIKNDEQPTDSGSHSVEEEITQDEKDPLNDSLNFLIEYEFIRLQMNEETNQMNYVPTRLGMACLSSSLPPNDGLLLFSELQKSRRCFVLETELHAVYLVTPYSVCFQLNDIDWLLYLDLHEKLSSSMKRVAELVGVKESFLVKAMRGHAKLDYKALQIHKRFYTAMALQELVNEVPLNRVSTKYKCSRGLLQSLQQMSSTFAGIVTSFCNALNWTMLALIVSEFKERLFFGVHRDLIDLMRIPDLNAQKARALFNAGITGLVDLANADCFTVEKILFNSISFDSEKQRDDEDEYDKNKRNIVRCLYITGRLGLTVKDVAKLLVTNARLYLQYEMGVENVKWSNESNCDQENNTSEKSIALHENSLPSIPNVSDNNNENIKIPENPNENKEKSETIPIKCGISTATPGSSAKQNIAIETIKSPPSDVKLNDRSLQRLRKSATSSNNIAKFTPRRSPRNHTSKSSIDNHNQKPCSSSEPSENKQSIQDANAKCDANAKSRTSDIFNDSTLDINTQIAGAMDEEKSPNTNHDLKYISTSKTEEAKNLSPINKSVEEIVESQTPKEVTPSSLRSNTTRMARTRLTQKRLLRKTKKLQVEMNGEDHNIPKTKTNASSSIEISDCASSSLLHNPLHLNSSHVLSTSKTEQTSASFKSISIIDICGDRTLFTKCFDEIINSKNIGLSVAVQKLAHKRRPVIGANLLVNQVQSCEEETSVEFVFDEIFYVCGISLCSEGSTVFFLNLQNKENKNCLSKEERIKTIVKIFNSDKLVLRIFDAKEQLKVLKKCIPELDSIKSKVEDPKVGNWLIQPDKEMSLKNIVQQYAPECCALTNLAGTYATYRSIGLDCTSSIFGKVRASIEACVCLHVLDNQLENLERIGNGNLKAFFHDLEMPVQCALWKMEALGFPVDQVSLGDLSKLLLEVMKKLEQKIFQLHGSKFNLSSSSAVARVLGLYRKPNGKLSTAKQILEKIDSPMSNLILNYRKLGATLNKTIQPLIQCATNGRIHGNSITYTATGRISMHEPNLQNVTKDFTVDIDGGESFLISCRSSFACANGISLISVDFCQLEMRILTHLSQDQILMKIMHSEDDIFQAIAARWNKIEPDEVSENLRNGTKQICYGIIYGMGLKSLAESLKCDSDEATSLVEQFHTAYPGIRSYTNKVIKFAKQNGYVETITGRRRYLPNITSTDEAQRGQAERQALNTTIQGSAADIAKKAIIRTERNLEKYSKRLGLTTHDMKFVLHLHDELMFEVPDGKIIKVAKVLRASMENSAQLNVPLRVKLKAGKSWGTLHKI